MQDSRTTHARTAVAALLALVACALGGRARAGEGETAAWKPDVPPGIREGDADRGRFRVNPAKDPLRGFEDNASGWGIESWKERPGLGEPELVEPERTDRDASEGAFSLVLPVEFPRATALLKRSRIGEFRYVTYDVFIPKGCPGRARSLFFLKDKDGLWFQALSSTPLIRGSDGTYRPGPSPFRLEPGKWNTVKVDLRPGRSDLVPQGHLARWQERLARETEIIGFGFLGDEPYEGQVLFDNLRGWALAEDDPRPLAVRNLTFPGRVGTHARWEAEFELTREFENPFDPREIRVDCVVETPSGGEASVPGFYSQDFQRRLTTVGEELVPAGPGTWKVRYAAREPGEHRFTLEVEAGGENQDGDGHRLVTRERAFHVVESDHPGYIRVSKRDPRCFEFENGEPFYPIGHNFRSPNDTRSSQVLGWSLAPDQGTFTYDRILKVMADSGENFAEIWMASWWVAIEWTARWKYYHGLGRYNLANAWRLDHVLDKARELGIRVHLVIDNHGKYSSFSDPEWGDSPYNVRDRRASGGFLTRPEDFFVNEHAKRLYKQKTRYLFARWGYDPTIFGFELVSELDLTGSRYGFGRRTSEGGPLRSVHHWHKEMTEHFATVDAGRHLYTTHYCNNYSNVDPVMARLPGISYVVGDGYRDNYDPFPGLAYATSQHLERFGKPFMITEYGGAWHGTSEGGLEADLHSGLWSSYMTAAGGTPLLWWFDFLDRRDLYWHFAALARFNRGEDRRDPELKARKLAVEKPPSGVELRALAYMSKKRGYGWVYSERAMTSYPAEPIIVEGARVRLVGLRPGPCKIEFWDTVAGERVRSEIVTVKTGGLSVALPRFANDVAMKFALVSLLADRNADRNAGRGGTSTGARGRAAPREENALSRGKALKTAARAKGMTSTLLAPREVAGAPREEEFILNWAILGPFRIDRTKLGENHYREATRFELVKDEAGLVPRIGAKVGGCRWRQYRHPSDRGHPRSRVDLEGFFEGEDYCVAYVAADVVCASEMRDVSLLVGSDDCVRAYLNGKLIITYDEGGRSCGPDQDRAKGLSLRRGTNRLVLKVVDVTGDWACCARFATADGRAIPVRGELLQQ